jgi:hypothetical protein
MESEKKESTLGFLLWVEATDVMDITIIHSIQIFQVVAMCQTLNQALHMKKKSHSILADTLLLSQLLSFSNMRII